MGQFESLLDTVLQQQQHDKSGSLDAGSDGGERARPRPQASSPSLLSCRSLSAGFWALGNLRHPLSQEMMDKLAGENRGRCAV